MGRHPIFAAGIFGKSHKDKKISDLVERKIDQGKTGAGGPDNNRPNDNPDECPCAYARQNGQQRILRDIFGKKSDGIGACSEIEHMSEGEPSHKPIEDIESENIDTEDHKVGSAVNSEEGKQNQKPAAMMAMSRYCQYTSFYQSQYMLFHRLVSLRFVTPCRFSTQERQGGIDAVIRQDSSKIPYTSSPGRSLGR